MREVDSIKVELEEFFLSMREFRNSFRANAPFTFGGSPNDAYKLMDAHASDLVLKEQAAKGFNESEELFELVVSKYQETVDTRNELRMLKYVWDMKALVLGTFESWNPLLWNDIKTDALEDVNKGLQKNLRKIASENPVIKGWKVYRDIEEEIKNMNLILPLINELHSQSMRERHWTNLARVCNVKQVDPNDPKFTFEDCVKLKIHERRANRFVLARLTKRMNVCVS